MYAQVLDVSEDSGRDPSSQSQDPTSQLEFQDFSNVREAPPSGRGFTLPPPVSSSSSGPSANAATASFWKIEYYAKYFDVDTTEVIERATASIVPTKDFFSLIAVNPDLYGPFWIPTTVIFLLFATSNVSRFIANMLVGKANQTSAYDMNDLSWAITSVYTFVTIIPALVWGVARYYKLPLKLLEAIDVYGYGMVIWIPVSVCCVIPNEIVKWIAVCIAFVSSVIFKIKNLQPLAVQAQKVHALFILAAIVLITQGGLAILFKLVFFKYIQTGTSAVGGASGPPLGNSTKV